MDIKEKDVFTTELAEAFNKDFKGWDFSYLEIPGRMHEYPLSWNYTIELLPYLKKAGSLLDMGTGGGEYLAFLSSLHPLPKASFATESYAPNVAIARERLAPLGIEVRQIADDHDLPFADNMFDLIINRHESYFVKEVYRILKPGGVFLTQQVGGMNDYELNEFLQTNPSGEQEWNLAKAVQELQQIGMKILKQKEDYTKTRFYDIGAIIYYLKAVPWQIIDFAIDKYYERLKRINEIIMRVGFIDFTCHRFLVVAQK